MELEQALRQYLAEADAVPADLTRYAVDAFAVRGLDEELTELTWDSLVDVAGLARGPAGPRMLVFESVQDRAHRIEVELTRTVRGFDLIGQVVPPSVGELRVIHRRGTVSRPVDDRGRFDAELPNVAALRLWFRSSAAATDVPIVTGWVPIG
ncbi:MAG TPA: hypothetical protein VF657_10175 [Actinoplanes sp.]